MAWKIADADDRDAVKASGAFDALISQIDAGQLQIDSKDVFLNQTINLSQRMGYRGTFVARAAH